MGSEPSQEKPKKEMTLHKQSDNRAQGGFVQNSCQQPGVRSFQQKSLVATRLGGLFLRRNRGGFLSLTVVLSVSMMYVAHQTSYLRFPP